VAFAADPPAAVLTIGTKTFAPNASGTGVWYDLCLPSNLSGSVDSQDTRWPSGAWDAISGDRSMWGVGTVTALEFGAIAAPKTADTVALIRGWQEADGYSTATFLPEFAKWEDGASGEKYRQFVIGDTDGRRSMEETDGYQDAIGDWYQITLGGLLDTLGTVTTAGGTANPGWTCGTVAGIGAEDGEEYSAWGTGWFNVNRPATWLNGGGATYRGSAWRWLDVNANSSTALYAQGLADAITIYPGCGDGFGLVDTPGGSIIVARFAQYRRAAAGGLVASTSNVPAPSVTVTAKDGAGTDRGSGASQTRGDYRTGDPYMVGNALGTVSAQFGGSAPYWGGTVQDRSRRRLCFRGAGGAWISYDVSPWDRHARAYSDGTDIKLGFASDYAALSWADASSGLTGVHPCVRWQPYSREGYLWLSREVTAGGNITAVRTFDEGRTWSDPVNIAASGKWPTMVACRDGRIYHYWYDTGQVLFAAVDAFGGTVVSGTAIASGVDDDAIAADEYVTGGGVWRMKVTYRSGGAIVDAVSTDGRTWT
jgi:hypothetical protein